VERPCVMIFTLLVLYAADTWCMTAATSRRLDAFDQWCLRRILRIPSLPRF